MWLDVNGERMQNGSTATMVFGVRMLVSYLSHFMILEPGDVITTGTPPGVGSGMKPPRFLKAGDTMSLGIERLGQQAQRVSPVEAGVNPRNEALDRGRGAAGLYALAFVALYVDYLGARTFRRPRLSLAAVPYSS